MGGLTTSGVLTFFGPIILAAIGSLMAYRQAVKVTQEQTKYEGRKVSLSELQAVNEGQSKEIDRLRGDRDEDEKRFTERNDALEARLRQHREMVNRREDAIDILMQWARSVLVILHRPKVAAILQDEGIDVPSMPDVDGLR
jgi:hypothetical protein